MNTGWPNFVVLAIMLTGCSFQADRPAPVDSLSSKNHGPRYHKGSLKNDKYKVNRHQLEHPNLMLIQCKPKPSLSPIYRAQIVLN